ncbi:MFS transporter [Yinghuangia seranimata]|uniref:MFS transporter n=1 Tax=Yinghuangia seranimata TaxID=408067 RepID=UPI00248B7025|nr:MFS transporter [Yinghuangia seranimata]MDI2132071.1 MFS transporter [Yinghuangia seranimata]
MTSVPTAVPTAVPRITGRQRLVLCLLLGAGFMLAVDFSILNVALPEVGSGVGLGVTGLPWITSAFALPAAGFTLLFGRMADLFGRRRVFLTGVGLLAAASLLGGFATDPETLLTARVLQGFATAMATPASLSLLTGTFEEGPLRERALGLNGALLSGGFTAGALVGGTLVSTLSWRAAFFINVPVAVLILVATPLLVEESSVPGRGRIDLPGAVTVTGGLLAVVYSVVEKNALAGAAGVLLLVLFWITEQRAAAPLAPVRTLRTSTVLWGNLAGLVVFAMESAVVFVLTLYLQRILGFSPLATGLFFGVPGLAAVAAGVVAGRFIGRHGSRKVLVTALAVQGLTTVPLIFLGADRMASAVLVVVLFVQFFGHVTAIVGVTVTATSGLPNEDQGLAAGLLSMTQQVAITVGIPALSAVAATRSGELAGIHAALLVAAAVVLVSVPLTWWGLRPRVERHGGRDAGVVPDVPAAESLSSSRSR